MSIDTAHSESAGTQESVDVPESPGHPPAELPEHEYEWPPVAPPPATFREWEDGWRNCASDPRIQRAIDDVLDQLSPEKRKRIDRELRAK